MSVLRVWCVLLAAPFRLLWLNLPRRRLQMRWPIFLWRLQEEKRPSW